LRELIWLEGEVRTPPFSTEARHEAGVLLRRLQNGENIGMPHSRPMPTIGNGCHELRIPDADKNWRVMYAIADGCIVVLEVFNKTTQETPDRVIRNCQRRLRAFLED
jgi:phage-related protein